MSQMHPHKRGKRDGIRWAISWLHKRAMEMNDPSAKAVLNSAAFHMGLDLKHERDGPQYDPVFVEEILRIAKLPPEKTFNNLTEMLAWLDDRPALTPADSKDAAK